MSTDSLSAAEWESLPPILTPGQVARVVGVRPAQVLRWANAGTLPGRKIGRQWRFAKSSLTRLFGDNGTGPDRGTNGAGSH